MKLPSYKKPTKETTDRMRRVLRKGTDLEKAMAMLLRSEKIKYQAQPKLKGNPDFRILRTRIVVFCDSSFWHGRWLNTPKAETFYKNQDFWQAKLLRNRSKDRRISRDLKRRGWLVLRFWDEDISRYPERVAARIRETMKRARVN